jgi:hypothetical protein
MKRKKKDEKEAPSSNLQMPNKLQLPNPKLQTKLFRLFENWSLGFV